MRRRWTHHRPSRRRVGVMGLALALVAGLLMTVPTIAGAKDDIAYTIVFEHTDGSTTTVKGVASDNNHFVPDAGGLDPSNGSGMVMHLSCSDKFPGGWGEKEGPDPFADAEWRVQSYFIQKGDKNCGTPQPPPRPAIDIEKATNGFDADDPTGPEIPVGDPVTWTYVVTNTGDTPLTDVQVVDYVPTVGSADSTAIDCPKDTLAIDEVMTCEATGTAELGQYANEAKVTALGPAEAALAFDGQKKQYTFIFVDQQGNTVRVDGSSNSNEAFLPNAGGSSQANPIGMTVHVSCSDKFPGGWGAKDGPSQSRDSAFRIQDFWIREVKNGELKKQCGSPIPTTQMVMDQDPSHYIGIPGDPKIDIEKLTEGIDADTQAEGPTLYAGDPVEWTYIVTNTGDVDLVNVVVEDDIEGFIGTIGSLPVGETETLTKTGIVREGNYANEGCARGESESGEPVEDCDPSHYNTPDIDIEKLTEGHDADRPHEGPVLSEGDDVEWTYIVTNTGAVDLYDIDVVDDVEGYIGFIDFLAVGDSETLTLIGTVGDRNYGNEACATGKSEDDVEVEDCDPSHYKVHEYGRQPAVDIEKATNGHDADHPTGPRINVGDTVTWTYEVTNTGSETLWGVFVYDEEEGRVDCPTKTLYVGDSMTCTMHGKARPGQYANEAWVTAWGVNSMVSDTDWSHYYGAYDYPQGASIDLEKATNGHDADTPSGPQIPVGDTVTWTYTLTNTGDVTLWAVFLYDEEEGRVDCPERRLYAGDSMTCTITGHAEHGQYANEAWVTAWTEDDRMVTDEDWSHYYGKGSYGYDN